MAIWHTYATTVTMQLLAPGEKLSEVELLKLLNAYQWESISRLYGVPTPQIRNDGGERLYASVLHVELSFGEHHSPDRFGEGASLVVRNRVRTFADRFVEGLFVFADDAVPDDALASLGTREALRAQARPYAYMLNTFVRSGPGNASLTVYKPAGTPVAPDVLAEPPAGFVEHGRVQRSGEISPFDDGPAGIPLAGDLERVRYQIVPESDLNGANLIYFARYAAMTNYAERVLGERLPDGPLSNAFVETLSTERRRIYYFANAAPKDGVDMIVRASVLPVDGAGAKPSALPIRTPLKLAYRMDLHRTSDHQLIASSLVRKALNVPASNKAVLAESERLLGRLVRTGSR